MADKNFETLPGFRTYVSEVSQLAEEIVTLVEDLFSYFPKVGDGENQIIVDPVPHRKISSLLSCAAKLQRLFKPLERKKGEASSKAKWRQRRGRMLSQLLMPDSVTEILSTGVRNRIEHADEYLDDLFRRKQTGRFSDPVIYNMCLSSRSVFTGGAVYYVKAYIIDEAIYVHFDREVSIASIYEEAKIIIDKANSILPKDERGGGAILMPNSSTTN